MKTILNKKNTLIPFLTLAMVLSAGECLSAATTRVTLTPKAKIVKDNKVDEVIKENSNTGNDTTITTETDTEDCTIELKIKSKGEPITCDLHWCFIAEDSKTEETITFSPGTKKIELAGDGVLEETIVSEQFARVSVSSDSSTATDKVSGQSYEGYLIVVSENGNILATKSNTSRYTKDEWVKKCMNPPAPKKGKGDKGQKNK